MRKEELFKKWDKYYKLNVLFSITPTISIVIALYLWACGVQIEVITIILSVILIICLASIAIISKRISGITEKKNLNSFLQIAIDEYENMAYNGLWGKRKLNKQMTFALNLKIILGQYNNTDNESRKKLFDFIENGYYLKNGKEFIALCENCLTSKGTYQKEIDENEIDKSSIYKLTLRFILSNVKIVIFYSMVISLLITIFISYFGGIYNSISILKEIFLENKEAIDTANTIVFDIAAILLLYFEIKQEDI